MKILSILKKLILYSEPQSNNEFELLEDEPYESDHGPLDGRVIENTDESGDTKGEAKDISQTQTSQSEQSGKKATPVSYIEWNQMRNRSEGSEGKSTEKSEGSSACKSKNEKPIDADLLRNLKYIEQELNSPLNKDIVIRKFRIMQSCDAFVVYIDGMADKETINNYILRQLMLRPVPENEQDVCTVDYITDNLLAANEIKRESDFKTAIREILNGLTALFIDGSTECVIVETRGYESRSVSEPLNETVVYGPHEAFVEQLRTNITLVRKILRTKDLITEIMPIGNKGQISCALLYIKGVANPKLVEEMKRRLEKIDIDISIGSGIVDQLIEQRPFSIFPQSISTERPDRTATFLANGHISLIFEGTPLASIVPITFFDLFHTSDDSLLRWQYSSFQRYIRLVACCFSVFLPGLYLALTLYHTEMIPSELMSSLHQARENVPFPGLLEVLIMELTFEIIREAGIRIPGAVGQTLGIIGAIVLGQAAVGAGLVSPVLIIIVAVTGLGNFSVPDIHLSYSLRIVRFVFILLGTMAGFYGISLGLLVLFVSASSLKSFGVPYFSPVAPKTEKNPDVITRGAVWSQTQRPDYLNTGNRRRAGSPVMNWQSKEK